MKIMSTASEFIAAHHKENKNCIKGDKIILFLNNNI